MRIAIVAAISLASGLLGVQQAALAEPLVTGQQTAACDAQWRLLNAKGQPGLAKHKGFMRTCMADTNGEVALSGQADMRAPAGATGMCKDGRYTASTKREGACGGHGGLSRWLTGS